MVKMIRKFKYSCGFHIGPIYYTFTIVGTI